MTVEDVAKITYEANKALCENQGDFTFTPWDLAPDWQKQTNINGVRFHLVNPDATPETSHESWLAAKEAEGWQWGPVKNAEKKIHPAFLPYAQLPANQKPKDNLFKAIVDSLRTFITI